MSDQLFAATADLHADLVRLRRDLHREPELGLDLPRNAIFDDAVLTDGAALLAELALRRLATAT